MDGTNSTVSANGSGLDALTQLATLFGGTNTTRSGDTSYLKSLLATMQGDTATQVQNLIASTLAQSPAVQARYSNAVGARSGNNAASQTALNQLLEGAALKATALQQQSYGTQAQIASAIANANSSTQQGTNLSKAVQGIGALTALNKSLDGSLAKGAKDLWDLGKETAGQTWADMFGSGVDLTGSLASNATDLSSVATYAAPALDLGSAALDAINANDFTFGFADGGVVKARSAGGRASSAPTYTADAVAKTVSDVTSGDSSQAGSSKTSTQAVGVADSVTGKQMAKIAMAFAAANPVAIATALAGLMDPETEQTATAVNSVANAVQAASPISVLSAIANTIAAVSGNQSSMATSSEATAANEAADKAARDGAFGGLDSTAAGFGAVGDSASAGFGFGGFGGGDFGGFGGADGFGAGVGNYGGGFGDSAGFGFGAGGDAGASGDGGGSGMKSGGKVDGPGTGTSDSIPAKLSDGEYVIPEDVVRRLGVSFFDNLRAQYHTPK